MKRTFRNMLIASACLTIYGCNKQAPELSREEQFNQDEERKVFEATHMTRIYKGKTQEEVIIAAEKLLTLSDPKDTKFIHNKNGFLANRSWLWYAILTADSGIDKWEVHTEEQSNNSIKMTVTLNTGGVNYGDNSIYAIGEGITFAGRKKMTQPELFQNRKDLYSLFWKRMDYLLGKTQTWTTCEDFKNQLGLNKLHQEEKVKKGNKLNPLCGSLSADKLPEELRNS
ncbi:MAG: hypothetical protein VX730_06855 [Pseudomonadota bacterium]|nr:hypothetical protein [Pseudomonadota bacterium]